jgi:glycosidase
MTDSPETPTTASVALPKAPRAAFSLRPHPLLYEINTWTWLEQLSALFGKRITLANVPDEEWDALAKRGFDALWLMGVWQRSEESRRLALVDQRNPPLFDRAMPGWTPADVVGSPYAVANYVPDPRIGSWDDLAATRDKLHARGMALFVDFVGNHTALDHPWTREHPEYYVQGTAEDFRNDPTSFFRVDTPSGARFMARGKDPYFPPWQDTAQVNHFDPGLRAAEIADLQQIARYADGVRCDMAMLHLNDIFEKNWARYLKGAKPPAEEFWAVARRAVPGLTLLAEAYWGTEQRLLDLGFSFAYDKELYDALRDGNIAAVRGRLSGSAASQSQCARFLENHDEARCAAVFDKQKVPAAATLMGTAPGMRFYHQGELEGLKVHLPIVLRMPAPQPSDPEIAALFDKILNATKENVFHAGRWNLPAVTPDSDATNENLIAYEWVTAAGGVLGNATGNEKLAKPADGKVAGNEKVAGDENAWRVIVVNLSGSVSQGKIDLSGHALPEKEYVFHDLIDDRRYRWNCDDLGRGGLYVRLEAYQVHLFEVSAA